MKTICVVAAVICDSLSDKTKVFATAKGYGPFAGMWEFPGGKIEAGETAEEALCREIREELDTEIVIGDRIDTIHYDYPDFHLEMTCFWAEVKQGSLTLKEAREAKWLTAMTIDSVDWLPADYLILEKICKELHDTHFRVSDSWPEKKLAGINYEFFDHTNGNIVILKAVHHNCGLSSSESWHETHYELTASGELTCRNETGGNTTLRTVKLNPEQQTLIGAILNQIIKEGYKTHRDACDGSAWEITIQDKNGKEAYSTLIGYVYGLNALIKLTDELYRIAE